MQAVILAAGKGARLRPLTDKIPKPLIPIGGMSIIEHTLGQLPAEIDEIVVVIGYLGGKIKDFLGNEAGGRHITYVEQEEMSGTGGAIFVCRPVLRERFIVMMGDNIYCRADMERCLAHERSILTKEVKGVFAGGRIMCDGEGRLAAIEEGKHPKGISLVNTGLYVIGREFFDYDLVPLKKSGEFGLPQTLVTMSRAYPVAIELADFWLQINDLNELRVAEEIMKKRPS
jgi:NDP-sugar pyrophosphorylase family protein